MTDPEFDVEALDDALRLELSTHEDLSISPVAFAERHFPQEEVREEYVRQVADFMPETFQKDPGLIYQQLNTRKIEFENRVKISGPVEEFERSVQVIEQNADYTVVRIHSRRKA